MVRHLRAVIGGLGILLFATPITAPLKVGAAGATACESLTTSLRLPNTTITFAQTVAAGAFTPAGRQGRGPAPAIYSELPSFCRVAATLTPSPDSDIKVEVWLPVSGWNGKF